jgi:transposase
MRGSPDPQLAMLTSVSTEDLIPPDHPIRRIRAVVDAVLADLDDVFDEMYATGGRRSVPPEVLLKSTVLMAMYSIRSERAFCERLNYDLLFKWFLDMRIDQPAFDATVFTKNRKRLLQHEVADEFFAAVVRQAKLRRYVSSEHFSVDGTLLKAWASHKSFKPKGPPTDPPVGRNTEVQFHGERRSNDTHASTTDPQARLCRKSPNTAATLCFAGHLLMENRNALIVDAELTIADGYAERATAVEMLARLPQSRRLRTVAGDKGYDTRGFVSGVRSSGSPHTSPRTPLDNAPPSTVAPPATPATKCRCGSANASTNPSAGSRPSVADDNSGTEAANATGPGSRSPPPSTTSCASPPSTPSPPDPRPGQAGVEAACDPPGPAGSDHQSQPAAWSNEQTSERNRRTGTHWRVATRATAAFPHPVKR